MAPVAPRKHRPHHIKHSLRSRTHKVQAALVVGVASHKRKLQVLRKFSRRRADSQHSPYRKRKHTAQPSCVGHARRGGGPRPIFQAKGGFRAMQETPKLRPCLFWVFPECFSHCQFTVKIEFFFYAKLDREDGTYLRAR